MDIERNLEVAKIVVDQLLANEIPYYLVGSVAVFLHGARRQVNHYGDLDFFFRSQDASHAIDILRRQGFSLEKKHWILDGVKIGICTEQKERYAWLPDPSDPSHSIEVNGIRILEIEKLIRMKACVCDEILDKVQAGSSVGRRRRSNLIKHYSDFRSLVFALLDCEVSN